MPDEDQELAERWYERKSALIELSLGKQHDIVMHAIIPYAVGGGLDLYYYPNGVAGTAVATKELSEVLGECPSNDIYDCYELVMFTRHALDLESANDETTDFGRAHQVINGVLNALAPYSEQATLNPYETCEFPEDMDQLGGKCLVFDDYAAHSDNMAGEFGLLAVIEVFRSEMDYARRHGGAQLIERLREARHYPYSDLDRKPVA